jgi:hypothetical protein
MTDNYSDFLIQTLAQAEEALRQLQAENEALRKDAERYRPVAEVHESPFNGHRWIKGAGGVAVSELPLGTLYAKS